VRGAECEVQCSVLSAKFGVRLLSAEIFGSAGALPFRKTVVLPVATRYSPFAVFPTCRFADLTPCRNLARQEPCPPISESGGDFKGLSALQSLGLLVLKSEFSDGDGR